MVQEFARHFAYTPAGLTFHSAMVTIANARTPMTATSKKGLGGVNYGRAIQE
jgi:hypothetical protein